MSQLDQVERFSMYDGQQVSAFAEDDTIGGRISLARDALNVSVEEISAIVGVTPETWQDWENDRAAPRANRLDKIAGVLQVSLAWLLSGRGIGPSWDNFEDKARFVANSSSRFH